MPDDEIEARFTRLEHEVTELREQVTLARSDAAAARVLASGADQDVSEVRAELRAHTQGLNALRETQLEQGWAIHELRRPVRSLCPGRTIEQRAFPPMGPPLPDMTRGVGFNRTFVRYIVRFTCCRRAESRPSTITIGRQRP